MQKTAGDRQSISNIDDRSSNIGLAMSQSKRVSALRSPLSTLRSYSGFTALELIIVMMVLSVLVISFTVKNPFTTGDYSTIAADQLIADIRYVQMRAMGVGTSQNITLTANSYTVAGEQKSLPNGIAMSGTTTFTFNSLGEPTIGGDGVITVGGIQNIKVFSITGYVCKCKNIACNASECLN